jgi:hypothetical protein
VGTPGETLPDEEMDDGEGGAISCKRELCGCQGVLGGDSDEIGTFFTVTRIKSVITVEQVSFGTQSTISAASLPIQKSLCF